MKTVQRLICGTAAILLLATLPSGCTKKAKVERKLGAAKEHLEKADFAAAEIEFKNLLALEPGNPKALKGLGLIWVRQGATFEGARILSEAKNKLPKDDEVGVNLALAFLDLGFVADSRKELLEVLDRTPAQGEALMLLAETSLTPEAMTECEERITRANASDQASVLLASALIELRRGQIDAGTRTVERVLEIAPDFPRALALQATLFRMIKLPEQALAPMKKASDLAGPRSSERDNYAKLLMELVRPDDALALLTEATRLAPDYLPHWRLLAMIAIDAGNDAEAATNLSKVLAKSPLDIEAGLLQAQLWIRGNEPAKAVELLEKANKTFPSNLPLALALAKAYLAADNSSHASEILDRVLAIAPRTSEAVLLRSRIYLKDGQPAEAISLIEPLFAAEPKNRTAQDLLVAAYSAANRIDDAVAILKRQAAASPKDEDLQLQLGQLLRAQGKAAEARAIFERLLERSPNQLEALFQLVSLDQQEGKGDEALARINACLTAHPESPQAHLVKAQLCFARKDHKAAETAAEKAIQLQPENTAAYGLLVCILAADGRADEAIARFRKLIEATPDNLVVRMNLGTLLHELGRSDEARACFEEIVKIAPKFAAAYNNLAEINLMNPENLDKALEYARKARSLSPDDPSINDTYGWIQWLRGDYRQALPLLREAANRLFDAPSVQYHLAMAHYMMDQVPEAMAAFEKALAVTGGFPEKDQAVSHLAILRDGEQLDLAALEQRVKEAPKDVVLMVLLAKKRTAAGSPQDAAAAYQSALAVNPDLEVAQVGLAELYSSALNQPDKALEAATQARKIAPQSPRAAAVLGAAKFRLGSYEEAYNLLAEAARKLPDDPGVQVDYTWAAYSMGRVDEARSIASKIAASDVTRADEIKEFLAFTAPNAASGDDMPVLVEKTLAKRATYVPALMVRAALLEKAGESPAETYAKVLGVFPEFNPARKALARVYLDDPKQLEAAEKLANAARERLKDDLELSGILAIVNFRKGQFDYAAQLLKELSSKRPLTGPELFALGVSQANLKRVAEARQTLTQALETKLPAADAAKAKAALDELETPDADYGK